MSATTRINHPNSGGKWDGITPGVAVVTRQRMRAESRRAMFREVTRDNPTYSRRGRRNLAFIAASREWRS